MNLMLYNQRKQFNGKCQYSDILLLSHISDLSGPTEALEKYLVGRAESLTLIYNPLEYCRIKRRLIRKYKEGRLVKENFPADIRYKKISSWVIDCLVIVCNVLRAHDRYYYCIGCNGLNALLGLFFKKVGRVKKVILYSIDWTPQRFNNKLLNSIYHFIDRYAARKADFTWNVSSKIIDVRMTQGIEKEKNIFVPVGIDKASIPIVSENEINFNKIVFLGALEKTKGIELVIDAWPIILKHIPKAKLVVIGRTPTGEGIKPYEERLRQMDNVECLGVLSHDDVLKTIVKCGIGLAPYSDDSFSISHFSDPSRIKDYLGCGLPVVVTRVPYIAKEIEEEQAGEIIEYNVSSLVSGIKKIINNDSVYMAYRDNAARLGNRYSWNDIFSTAFYEMTGRINE